MDTEETREMAYECDISELRKVIANPLDEREFYASEFAEKMVHILKQIQDSLNALDNRIALLESKSGSM